MSHVCNLDGDSLSSLRLEEDGSNTTISYRGCLSWPRLDEDGSNATISYRGCLSWPRLDEDGSNTMISYRGSVLAETRGGW